MQKGITKDIIRRIEVHLELARDGISGVELTNNRQSKRKYVNSLGSNVMNYANYRRRVMIDGSSPQQGTINDPQY